MTVRSPRCPAPCRPGPTLNLQRPGGFSTCPGPGVRGMLLPARATWRQTAWRKTDEGKDAGGARPRPGRHGGQRRPPCGELPRLQRIPDAAHGRGPGAAFVPTDVVRRVRRQHAGAGAAQVHGAGRAFRGLPRRDGLARGSGRPVAAGVRCPRGRLARGFGPVQDRVPSAGGRPRAIGDGGVLFRRRGGRGLGAAEQGPRPFRREPRRLDPEAAAGGRMVRPGLRHGPLLGRDERAVPAHRRGARRSRDARLQVPLRARLGAGQ